MSEVDEILGNITMKIDQYDEIGHNYDVIVKEDFLFGLKVQFDQLNKLNLTKKDLERKRQLYKYYRQLNK